MLNSFSDRHSKNEKFFKSQYLLSLFSFVHSALPCGFGLTILQISKGLSHLYRSSCTVKLLFLFLLHTCSALVLVAQQQSTFNISGTVKEQGSLEALISASVRLFPDTTIRATKSIPWGIFQSVWFLFIEGRYTGYLHTHCKLGGYVA